MKTTVFAHRGIVGIESDLKSEGLLNNPAQPGQLGFVLDASTVRFSPEAVEELKKVKRSHDDLGEVDIFQTDDKRVIFGWLGGIRKAFKASDIEGSSSYDASLITSSADVETPQDFIDFVDGMLDQNEPSDNNEQ